MDISNLFLLVLYLLALWALVFPGLTLLHECGHALTALALTDHPVKIILGDERAGLKAQLGRLHLVFGWLSGFIGFTRYSKEGLAPWRILAIALAGPLVSLALAGMSYSLACAPGGPPWLADKLRFLSYAALAQFLVTILPMRYPRWLPGYAGYTSDGWRILEILRRRPI